MIDQPPGPMRTSVAGSVTRVRTQPEASPRRPAASKRRRRKIARTWVRRNRRTIQRGPGRPPSKVWSDAWHFGTLGHYPAPDDDRGASYDAENIHE